ncbi:isoleucine-tRNA ligase [Massospora cicadina]|nr:isoleucine-tRNA ligase [Massospora cicadina]
MATRAVILRTCHPVPNRSLPKQRSPGYNVRGVSTARSDLGVGRNSYKDTILLPQTNFSIRYAAAEVEKKYRARCTTEIYRWQGETNQGPEFIIHDGPPYANGSLHIGHAFNKVLKDIINRYRLLRGYRIRYIPGWDCHGLPIELKALAKLKATNLSPLDIRRVARETAIKAIGEQMADLKRWGIMADWDDFYRTLDPPYIISQLEVFRELHREGYVYRQYRPCHWSPSSQTALAESELEYNANHVSTAAYVKVRIKAWGQATNVTEVPTYALVWTTTPWTLTANQAIAVHPELEYGLFHSDNCNYLMASSLEPRLSAQLKLSGPPGALERLQTLLGAQLRGTTYLQPITDEIKPFILASFVTETAGTGLVHAAPGHGMLDYLACQPLGIEPISKVDRYGKFMAEAGPRLQGKDVLKEGTQEVLAMLAEKGLLASQAPYVHAYPYDWRTKKPIIQRTTAQWFVSLAQATEDALRALDAVTTIPPSGRNRLTKFLQSRSEWCISRQRCWGSPSPCFTTPTQPLLEDEVIRHVIQVIQAEGPDAWWGLPVEALLPAKYAQRGVAYVKGTDTMDVWFDSGTSWTLIERRFPRAAYVADVYLEGSDQHRGWFQSSLLTAIGTVKKLPFRTLITHGFITDAGGAKMSKSVGNVIAPDTLIDGGKNTKPMGADGLRFWVAASDYTQDVSVGPGTLMRNSVRFMLANLFDFHESKVCPYHQLHAIDRLTLHELNQLTVAITDAFDAYAFNHAVLELFRFASHLSSFYFDVTKDRLYLMRADSPSRRSAQTVLFHLLGHYLRFVAPVGCHMAEEMFDHAKFLFASPPDSVFKLGWPQPAKGWEALTDFREWEVVHQLRATLHALISAARDQRSPAAWRRLPGFTSPLRRSPLPQILLKLEANRELTSALLVSGLTLSSEPIDASSPHHRSVDLVYTSPGGTTHKQPATVSIAKSMHYKCPRCWMWVAATDEALCARCRDLVNSLKL